MKLTEEQYAELAHEPVHYVYTLAYPESMGGDVFYVGKGRDYKNEGNYHVRIDDHEKEAYRGKRSHKCSVIRKIWATGEQIVKAKIAHFATHEEAYIYEIALIFLMRGYGHLTNLTDGGEGTPGREITEVHRYKLSEAGKTYWQIATKDRRKINGPFKDHTHTEQARHKISEANKSRPTASNEYRQKLSEAGKGHAVSEETRRKLSEAHKTSQRAVEARHKVAEMNRGRSTWSKGKTFTLEHRRKISEAAERREMRKRSQVAVDREVC